MELMFTPQQPPAEHGDAVPPSSLGCFLRWCRPRTDRPFVPSPTIDGSINLAADGRSQQSEQDQTYHQEMNPSKKRRGTKSGPSIGAAPRSGVAYKRIGLQTFSFSGSTSVQATKSDYRIYELFRRTTLGVQFHRGTGPIEGKPLSQEFFHLGGPSLSR